MTHHWTPDSWRERPAKQQPTYTDTDAVHDVIRHLGQLPPLVTAWEIDKLRGQMAEVAHGNAFLLQGGDCSESLQDCNANTILRKLKV